jgi:DNA-binding beta-propeller fold protein YncE
MRRLVPLLALAALGLASCSQRERANPFDPQNPNTSGRPSAFVALAGDREARLRWRGESGGSLAGYQLYRRSPGESEYRAITDVLGTEVTTFRDFPLVNGQDYAYRLYFVFVYGLGSRPAEDVATPGAAIPWLIEAGGPDLVRITADGRRVADRRGGYGATTDLAANPGDGTVWIADEGLGRVVIYSPSSGVTVSVPQLDRPRAVAVDPFDGTGWVCDVGQNVVHHFRPQGDKASEPIAPLEWPVDVAVDPQDGSVWVCELGADRVGRFDATEPIWRKSVPAPSRAAVDSATRDGWITSYAAGAVTRIGISGQPVQTFTGFTSPLGVAVDARRGRIWIADPGAGEVVALRRDGSVEFRVAALPDVGEISVDPGTGEAWAVLGDAGELARISPAGTLLRRMGGLNAPYSVSVDPGGR